MNKKGNITAIYEQLCSKFIIGGDMSVNDLRDMYYNGKFLSKEQKTALRQYDAFRMKTLHAQMSEEEFHNKYMELQVMANLCPYREFLKSKYEIRTETQNQRHIS